MNGQDYSRANGSDEDFELMGELPREDPAVTERRRVRNNEISKKLGSYLLKGYCMLSDSCSECECILLRTPDRQLLCVGCAEVDVENGTAQKPKEEKTEKVEEETQDIQVSSAKSATSTGKKSHGKGKKKRSKKTSSISDGDQEKLGYSQQLEAKLKWAVDELSKSDNPSRINAMCTVITKLTESIKALKEYEASMA